MRVVLADLRSTRGFVSKDPVVGGFGSRLQPFSRVTAVISYLKKQFHDVPSVHMAYMAAILTRGGHEVAWTRDELAEGDVALVLSSLVDYRNETSWADRMRARGVAVGFVGITASKMPDLFGAHCDFILDGEPEAGVMRLAQGEALRGIVRSDQVRRPYVIFRDPLFSEQRDRCFELCDEIQARDLTLTFEAETRLDRLDVELLDKLYAAGFRAMSFGVESTDPATLKKSGRRPIPQAHQREIMAHCRTL